MRVHVHLSRDSTALVVSYATCPSLSHISRCRSGQGRPRPRQSNPCPAPNSALRFALVSRPDARRQGVQVQAQAQASTSTSTSREPTSATSQPGNVGNWIMMRSRLSLVSCVRPWAPLFVKTGCRGCHVWPVSGTYIWHVDMRGPGRRTPGTTCSDPSRTWP